MRIPSFRTARYGAIAVVATTTAVLALTSAQTAVATNHGAATDRGRALSTAADQVGSCTRSQLNVGKLVDQDGTGTQDTEDVFVKIPIRNAGPRCTLRLPNTIRVAKSSGPFTSVKTVRTGRASSFVVRHDAKGRFVVGAWWAIPVGMSNAHCAGAVRHVERIAIPLTGSDPVEIELKQPWANTCKSPAHTSLSFDR